MGTGPMPVITLRSGKWPVRQPALEPLRGKGSDEHGKFRVDRLFDQIARSIAQIVSERVGAKSRWIEQLGDGSTWHVAYPFLSKEPTASRHRLDMPPLRALPTFARFSKTAVSHSCCNPAAARSNQMGGARFGAPDPNYPPDISCGPTLFLLSKSIQLLTVSGPYRHFQRARVLLDGV